MAKRALIIIVTLVVGANLFGWAQGWPGLDNYSGGSGIYTMLLENSPNPSNDSGRVTFYHGVVSGGVWDGNQEFYTHNFTSLDHWVAKASTWEKAYWASYESGIHYCRPEMWPTELQNFFTRPY